MISCQVEAIRFVLNEFGDANEGDEFFIVACCCSCNLVGDNCVVVFDGVCLAENAFWNFAKWVFELMIAENRMKMKKRMGEE